MTRERLKSSGVNWCTVRFPLYDLCIALLCCDLWFAVWFWFRYVSMVLDGLGMFGSFLPHWMNCFSLRTWIKERLSQCSCEPPLTDLPVSTFPIAILHLLSIGSFFCYQVHPRFGSCSRSSSKCHRCAVEDRKSSIINKHLFHVVPPKVKANGVYI